MAKRAARPSGLPSPLSKMPVHIIHWIALGFFGLMSLGAFLSQEDHPGLQCALHIIGWSACAIAGLMLYAIRLNGGLGQTFPLVLLAGACLSLAFGLTVWGFHNLRQ